MEIVGLFYPKLEEIVSLFLINKSLVVGPRGSL